MRADAANTATASRAEGLLRRIFSEVLRVDDAGAEDSFFDMGGDSISALIVRARARDCGLEIAIDDIYLHQSARAIAAALPESAVRNTFSTVAPFALVDEDDRLLMSGDIEDAYPCTILQQGMLFHAASETDLPVFINADVWQFRGVVDLAAFRRAVRDTVMRHPLLRTSFDLLSYSEPLQLVHRNPVVHVQQYGLPEGDEASDELWLSNFVREERRLGFQPDDTSQVRFAVVNSADRATFYVVSIAHHAVFDGTSNSVLFSELFDRYACLRAGTPYDEQLTGAFVDYVARERDVCTSKTHERFWTKWLGGLEDLQLPVALRLPPSAACALTKMGPGQGRLDLPDSLLESLQRSARAARVPLKTLLLAAHLWTLRIISSNSSVVTGYHVHQRTDTPGALNTIGLFLNTVPLVMRLHAKTWRDLAKGVFDAERELMPFSGYPMALMKKRHGGTPLFETAFNFTQYRELPRSVRSGTDLDLTKTWSLANTDIPLTLQFHVSASKLVLHLLYHESRFDDACVMSIAECCLRVLQMIAADIEAAPSAVFVEQDGRSAIVPVLAGEPVVSAVGETSILARFLERAALHPDRIAITSAGGCISYGELLSRAQAVAGELARAGAAEATPIGVYAPRSIAAVVSYLAAQLCGCPYVPLDPALPDGRILQMASRAGIRIAATDPDDHETALRLFDTVVRCDAPAARTEAVAADRVQHDPDFHILFTSGTTGVPKAVLIRNGAAMNRIDWLQRAYRLTADDCVLHSTAVGFDVAAWEIFWPLTHGARLFIADPRSQADATYIADVIERERISVIDVVPSVLKAWLPAFDRRRCSSVACVLIAGEPLTRELLAKAMDVFSAVPFNVYGPTEASLTAWKCEPGPGAVPIGRPIAGNTAFIVDDALRIVPPGVAGELCLAGAGLAAGYIGDDGDDAGKFVAHPFPGVDRMYRSGDFVRQAADGNIDYLGRRDRQVKVRGVRIELSEIESALEMHPAIEACSVEPYDGPTGDRALAAYVVWRDGRDEHSDVRRALSERLPPQMMPSVFVNVERLPTTTNGKLDRSALPTPWRTLEPSGSVEPSDETEAALATVWRTVFRLPGVGVLDNFFDLGGDSLVATTLAARCSERLGVSLSPVDILRCGDIRTLAGTVRG